MERRADDVAVFYALAALAQNESDLILCGYPEPASLLRDPGCLRR
jgi:hypothetical protein